MKMTKENDTELYVIAFKELINEVVSSLSREEAINYITREVLPNVKAAFKPERYQKVKRYAEEKLGTRLPD